MPSSPHVIEVTVESLGGLGDGIATYQNKPVFIPKSCPGDRLRVRIVHENRDGYQAAIEEVISSGMSRVAAPCKHFDSCGGCMLQALAPNHYHAFKTRMLRSALRQAGFPFPDAEVKFLPAASRRRVEFKVRPHEDAVALGFFAPRSNDLIAVEQCLVLEPVLEALIAPLNAALSGRDFSPHLRSVSLTAADSGIDMLLGVRQPIEAAPLMALAETLGMARLSLLLPDDTVQQVVSRQPVEMQLGKYKVTLPPGAFLQATRAAQQLLTETVLAVAGEKPAVDLFCGIGSYSLPLSAQASVHAVEGDEAMINAIHGSIYRHAIARLTAEQRDLFKHPLPPSELKRFETAIINPPRLGAKAQTEALAQSSVKTVIMISCNPATFARDAKILSTAGFTLAQSFAIDQFTWTPHLEIVAVFTR